MRRRVFVGSVFAGLAATPRPGKAKDAGIPKRKFGKTGVELTVVGQAGGRLGYLEFEDAVRVVMRAFASGVNYFDNARAYWNGRAEEAFGTALAGVRKEVFLTTKSTQRTREKAEEELHQSLTALKTDYVDLWQIHAVSEMEEVDRIFAPGGAIEAFEAAKKAGKCRFIGFTGHRDPHVHLEMLRRYDGYDTILMPLSLADANYLSFEKLVLPEAVKRGLGIQAMKTLGNAKLLQTFSVKQCLDYVLTLPVHAIACGATTIGQVDDDIRVAQRFESLPDAQMAELRKRAEPISGPLLEDWKRNIESA